MGIVTEYREEVKMFLDKFWDYYRDLLRFKVAPNEERAQQLLAYFDQLFKMPVKYTQLEPKILNFG